MATNTYVALATQTVTGSSAASVTFSSIPSGYTDLVLVAQPLKTTSGGGTLRYQVNSDTGTNYSNTILYGDGSSPGSDRASTASYGRIGFWTGDNQGNNLIAHFQNYSNTTTYKTVLSRTNNLGSLLGTAVNLWRSTSAITSIYIYNDGGNFAVGSTFTIYGIAAQPVATAKATGGTIYYGADGYTYHKFTSTGTFTPTVALTADILSVAGGGGGANYHGAGGGAGGVLAFAAQSLTTTGYTCTVGAGGAGAPGPSATGNSGTQGSNTQFAALTASVGGGSGGRSADGGAGGSGGGGSSRAGGAGTAGQGYAGGGFTGGNSSGGSGGGGAGSVGVNSNDGAGKNGGAGVNTYTNWGDLTPALSIVGLGVSGFIAGGGGGGNSNGTGVAGLGQAGGGNGGLDNTNSTAASANTGSGGGGGGGDASGYYGSAGGSGFIIVRYASV